ncbi:MAG: DUF4114 domain-containing protein [Verrucomicrobia bacterium]|nr:DUF4114 domain-containing protein [Verrucomicrobiota bacterium]
MSITSTLKKSLAIAAVSACAFGVQQSTAGILGGQIFVHSDGNVKATFVGRTAGYDNELYLHTPANGLGRIFHNHLNSPGDMFDLGYFTAGTELVFRLYVVNTGLTFYSGDGSLNPDAIPHAIVSEVGTDTVVGFEDLFGGGDRDYDDTIFKFSNARIHRVPDASATLPLLGAAMAGLAA